MTVCSKSCLLNGWKRIVSLLNEARHANDGRVRNENTGQPPLAESARARLRVQGDSHAPDKLVALKSAFQDRMHDESQESFSVGRQFGQLTRERLRR